jgi:hypothetical protein
MLSVLLVALLLAACSLQAQAACGAWHVATMSGYDNLDGADDQHPGCLEDYCGTTERFLSNVPVVSILQSDWHAHKYHNIEIEYKGHTGTVQSWDLCANADCGSDDKDCCTRNAALYGGNFLLDVEKRTLQKIWGLNYEHTLFKVNYRICDAFDPAPIAKRYGLHQ